MIQCTHCQKDTENPKFCSRRCSAIVTNKQHPKKKTKKKCLVCQAPVSNWRKTRCDLHTEEYKLFLKKSYKNYTIEQYINRPSIKNKHPSWKYSHIRNFARSWNKELQKQPCKNCGYKLHSQLAHIKAINKFPITTTLGEVNHHSNLLPLCPNCHWEFDHNKLTLEEIMEHRTGLEPAFSTPVTDKGLEDLTG